MIVIYAVDHSHILCEIQFISPSFSTNQIVSNLFYEEGWLLTLWPVLNMFREKRATGKEREFESSQSRLWIHRNTRQMLYNATCTDSIFSSYFLVKAHVSECIESVYWISELNQIDPVQYSIVCMRVNEFQCDTMEWSIQLITSILLLFKCCLNE